MIINYFFAYKSKFLFSSYHFVLNILIPCKIVASFYEYNLVTFFFWVNWCRSKFVYTKLV